MAISFVASRLSTINVHRTQSGQEEDGKVLCQSSALQSEGRKMENH